MMRSFFSLLWSPWKCFCLRAHVCVCVCFMWDMCGSERTSHYLVPAPTDWLAYLCCGRALVTDPWSVKLKLTHTHQSREIMAPHTLSNSLSQWKSGWGFPRRGVTSKRRGIQTDGASCITKVLTPCSPLLIPEPNARFHECSFWFPSLTDC